MAGPDTSGYRGWWPMRFLQRTRADGSRVYSQGFRNVVDGREFHPDAGWDGEPPYPTGDLACAHGRFGGSDEFWENLRKAPIFGKVVHQKLGKIVIQY